MDIQISQQRNNQNKLESEQCSDLDIFQMLSSALVTIAKSEQILQCIRQVLVSDPTFTPMILFKYVAGSSSQINRKNLITFLDQNNLVSNEKQIDDAIKKVFSRYGINSNNGVSYSSFLNFIYPYNSGVLRELLNSKVKKYTQLQKMHKSCRPSDSVVTAFLLLMEQQIKVEKRIQIQINDTRFPGKQKLKKVIKSIKKASQKTSTSVAEKSQNHISMYQLRNFIKAFIQVDDHIFLDLGRRLGLTKNGLIPIQNLQNILKKLKKNSSDQQNNIVQDTEKENKEKNNNQSQHAYRNKNENKYAKQMNFKQQLYKQLANTMKINQAPKAKTPRAKSAHRSNNNQNASKNRTPNKRAAANLNTDLSALDNSLCGIDNSGSFRNQKVSKQPIRRQQIYADRHYKQMQRADQKFSYNLKQKGKQIIQNSYVNNLFKSFVQTFLTTHKQIERSKSKLASLGSIDYLSLFKTLDNGRGVVDAQSMQRFYTKLSGIPIDFDFQLLIDRFAQPEQKWLSYSQFSQIFRIPTSKNDSSPQSPRVSSSSLWHDINGIKLHPEAIRILAQIIFLTLDLQYNLRKIIKKLKKDQIEWLFCRINIDSESKGFINYQQLKKYLAENLNMTIPMIDLMSLLKRLDKSKNGVVVKQQFLTY